MAGRSSTTFLAVHVPKCAGRTIEKHFHKHLIDEHCWITRKRFPNLPISWGRPYSLRSREQVKDVKFVSGHQLGRSIAGLLPNRSIKRSILLRDPASFHISYYNYRMMRYIAQGWRPYSFDVHLKSLPSDPICHFILASWCEISWTRLLAMCPKQKYDTINRELTNFWYVGDYTDCDDLVRLIGSEIGVPPVAERVNTQKLWMKQVSWQPLTIDELPPRTRRELNKRTRLDKAIWTSWSGARLNAANVEPVDFEAALRSEFPVQEAKRIYYSAIRRYQRGWFARASTS